MQLLTLAQDEPDALECVFSSPAAETRVKAEFGHNIRFVQGREERMLMAVAGGAAGAWLGSLVGNAWVDRRQRRLEHDRYFINTTGAWNRLQRELTAILDAAVLNTKGLVKLGNSHLEL